MRIGLIDIDGKMPNLALMKLSSWHKSKGDSVELTTPIFVNGYDKCYASKVFTWSDEPFIENAEVGGTGYDLYTKLPDYIENLCPDYTLYSMDYSMGFLTRGCVRKCEFCFVPEKEGKIKPASDIEEFLRHDKVMLLDNNVLAHEHGLAQIEKMARLKVKVDFNQGLDARLITDEVAKLLSTVKWLKPIRLACDSRKMMEPVKMAVELLRKHNTTPKDYSCYMLVENIAEAHGRAEFLRSINVLPFAQPYRAPDGKEPAKELKQFARWVNHRAIFKTVAWENYR